MVVLDTNVVSELMRDVPHAGVLVWVDDRPTRQLFVTAVTEAEVRTASRSCPKADAAAVWPRRPTALPAVCSPAGSSPSTARLPLMNRPAGGTGTMIKSPVEGKEANSIAGRTQDHNGSHLNLRCVLAQHSDEQRCRIGRQQPMRAEQNHAGRTAARKREDAAEVEIVGQDNEPVATRPLADLAVGGRAVTHGTPMLFHARVLQCLDPALR